MSVRVRSDLARMQQRIGRMKDKGRVIMTSQVHADSNMYAPRLTGDLRMQSQRVNNDKAIRWNVPYAAKQYYADGTWNYTTPGTGPKWDVKAKQVHLQSWIKVTKKSMERTK